MDRAGMDGHAPTVAPATNGRRLANQVTTSSASLEMDREASADHWIEFRRKGPAPLRLFCFPHAGGGAVLFSQWQKFFGDKVEVVPVQLPGRGRRTAERAIDNLRRIADEAVSALLPVFREAPFALFGHSMGALLAFEIEYRLETSHGLAAQLMLAAGSFAPSRRIAETTWDLPQAEFLERVRSMGGTPDGIFGHPELIDLFIPLLRADFRAVETYRAETGAKITCPVQAFAGSTDTGVSVASVTEWKCATKAAFRVEVVTGGHFFVSENSAELLPRVLRSLTAQKGV